MYILFLLDAEYRVINFPQVYRRCTLSSLAYQGHPENLLTTDNG